MAPAAILAFVGGAVTGSFLSVVAHRVPRGESIVGPRSRCASCGEQIAAYDNIPILSWLLLRGRCRHCGVRISVRYPLIEVGTGLAFSATVLVLHDDTSLILGLVFVATLAAITLTDLELRVIPNKVLIVAAVAGVVLAAALEPSSLLERAISAAAAGGMLFTVALVYPRGMGLGDVKLAAVMGLYLGRAVAPALLIAFAAGSLVGLAMIARHGVAARKQAIPFGPFLALGGLIGLLAGEEMVEWYLTAF
ncbi:MAG TPA: prepilin peptidase [Solirubrobacterales bacterium]|nr:prepilin peptidase [Solirubrobacterales bacterium]